MHKLMLLFFKTKAKLNHKIKGLLSKVKGHEIVVSFA